MDRTETESLILIALQLPADDDLRAEALPLLTQSLERDGNGAANDSERRIPIARATARPSTPAFRAI